jgi:DNA-binding XRE family transcriptional regulator
MNISGNKVNIEGKDFAIIDWKTFQNMQDLLEDKEDIASIREAILQDNESFPAELVYSIIDGEKTPLKAFREYREMTQAKLAEISGLNREHISDIENRKTSPTVQTLRKLAKALNLDIDDLIEREQE